MDENEKFGIKKDEIQSELIKTDEPTKNSDENAFEDNEGEFYNIRRSHKLSYLR